MKWEPVCRVSKFLASDFRNRDKKKMDYMEM